MIDIHLIAAARPNFMKVAPLFHALKRTNWAEPKLVHTGQHYDPNMSDVFLRDLELPAPDHSLGVGSGSHAEQTGGVMIAYEELCLRNRPDWIVVVGDVNSTVACAIVGAKLWIPVAHLEAGLRSGDRKMPEEINRILTDVIADLCWTPSSDGNDNLIAEGVSANKIDMVGNIMIDSIEMLRVKISSSNAMTELGLQKQSYALVTLHRPSNVDSPDSLLPIISKLHEVAESISVVFVAHPRTTSSMKKFGLYEEMKRSPGITLMEPLPYIEFMNIVMGARLVITDSGGLQEETTYLEIPCITLRENTERPITIRQGTNRLARVDELSSLVDQVVANNWQVGVCPPLWDGNAAARAVESLRRRIQ